MCFSLLHVLCHRAVEGRWKMERGELSLNKILDAEENEKASSK